MTPLSFVLANRGYGFIINGYLMVYDLAFRVIKLFGSAKRQHTCVYLLFDVAQWRSIASGRY